MPHGCIANLTLLAGLCGASTYQIFGGVIKLWLFLSYSFNLDLNFLACRKAIYGIRLGELCMLE